MFIVEHFDLTSVKLTDKMFKKYKSMRPYCLVAFLMRFVFVSLLVVLPCRHVYVCSLGSDTGLAKFIPCIPGTDGKAKKDIIGLSL
jgi:hypothetical protein